MLERLLTTILLAHASIAASLHVLTNTSSGISFWLGQHAYYAGSLAPGATGMVPTTSLHTNESHITDGVLVSQLARYGEIDDVWTTAFLQGLAISYSGSHAAHLDDSVLEWMSAHGIPRLYLLGSNIESVADDRITTFKGGLPPGPYLFVTSDSILSAHEVYRLHRDTYEAFLFGAIFDPVHDTFVPVEIDPPFNADQYIPLPSRLYSLLDTRPLAGKRFALKDIFDAKGLQTACGSHSYARIYPPATANSPAVQRLLDLGAVMVGKTKTSQFAHGANPWEFIDNKYPWNPRGDGYLTAASSSSGSACAIAGYDWIDFAVGSDTRGSVRKPASIVGSYGIRPTWGSMDLTGVMPMAEEMDTAGFFARDPLLFHQISSLWYTNSLVPVNATYTRYPSRILYPVDFFPVANPAAQRLYDDFVATLTREFNFTKTEVNMTAILHAHPVAEISNLTLFQLTSNVLVEHHSWTRVGKPLVALWEAMFGGYPPFDPVPRNAFSRAQRLTDGDYARALSIKRQFGDFFVQNVLSADDDSCSNAILMYDIGTGGLPSYREEHLNALDGATVLSITVPDGGVAKNYLTPMSGCPEMTVPLGQVEYSSHVSMQTEMLPVSVQLVAYRGCEGMLLGLIKEMAEMGYLVETRAGKVAFVL